MDKEKVQKGEWSLTELYTDYDDPRFAADMAELEPFLKEYCALFSLDYAAVTNAPFTVVTPDSANPYRQMYVAN